MLATERAALAVAMAALRDGDSRGFCDQMWLGLGDRWREVLRELAVGKFLEILDGESSDGIRITDRGRALVAGLESSRPA